MSQCTAVVGLQWGDEGKGKIVDLLAKDFDVVVRWNGGPNAGHTVWHNEQKFGLHQVPCGIFDEKTLVIGPECYVDLDKLIKELTVLKEAGYWPYGSFFIDKKATLMSAENRKQDQVKKISGIKTTGCGIGPCAADRSNREAQIVNSLDHEMREYLMSEFNVYISNTSEFLLDMLDDDYKVLFEGAQSIDLDNIHGQYPYVSQRCMTGGIFTSFGLLPQLRDLHVIGIAKAYVTRSGAGPMPSEMEKGIGNTIRDKGSEYGVTTGRQRRIGWIDIPQLKKTIRLSGAKEIVLTKVDILQNISNIKILREYDIYDENDHEYEIAKGFSNIRSEDGCNFIDKIEDLIETKISMISYGPKREQIFRR